MAKIAFHRQEQFLWIDISECDKRDNIHSFGYALHSEYSVYHYTGEEKVSIQVPFCPEAMGAVELMSGPVNGDRIWTLLWAV